MKLYNSISLLVIFASLIVQVNGASMQEYTKKISEEFEIGTDGRVEISNRYGHIEIVSSNRSTAEFEIEIKVEAKSQDRADSIFDIINIDFDNGSDYAKATTEIKSKSNWWGSKKKEKYTIHYLVYLPVNATLDVSNKYGDISMTDMNSDVMLNLKYGDARLGNIGGEMTAELGYVDRCYVKSISGDLDLQASYSNFNAEKAANVNMSSKYSEIRIEEADVVDSGSKYDDIKFGHIRSLTNTGGYDDIRVESIGTMNVKSKYTDINVGTMSGAGEFETSYGGVDIDDVTNGFGTIDIDGNYSGYSLGIQGSYTLDINTNYTKVSLPNNIDITDREKSNNKLSLKGQVGGNSGDIVRAKTKYGSLRLD